MMVSTKIETFVNYLVLSLFALAVVLPIGWLILAALSPKANAEVDLASLRPTNFVDAWVQSGFGQHLLNSVIICVGAVTLTAAVSILAAYGLTALAAPGRRILFPLFLAGIMIPLEGILVPLYYNLRSLGLTSSLLGLILAHTGTGVPFGVFWMRATFLGIPRELGESAEIDGAGRMRSLISIMLPVVRPALTTMVLLMFMWTWNDYFLAFVLINNENRMPVTLALGSFSTRHTASINLMAAAAILVSLPILILYVLFQRQFIQGVLSGALKG